jgi:hypothetical protein
MQHSEHSQDPTGLSDIYSTTINGASMLIEPFDLPGMVITNNLTLSTHKGSESLFNIVPGLDGNLNSISLELGTKPGCFLVSGANYSVGTEIQVSCKSSLQSIGGILRASCELCADCSIEAVPSNQLHSEGGSQELPFGAIIQLEGRILHCLLQHRRMRPCSHLQKYYRVILPLYSPIV